jgi:hypothetical protein
MAFKFNKTEQARMGAIIDKLRDIYDDDITEALSALNGAIDRYNEVLAEARGFVEDIYNERQGEFDDKSERWQEGDTGQIAQGWLSELEQIENLSDLPAYDDPYEQPHDDLENLPQEAE